MTKVLIINHDCLLNKGDASILNGMNNIIRKTIPNPELTILGFNPEIDRQRTSLEIKNGSAGSTSNSIRTITVCFIWRILQTFNERMANKIIRNPILVEYLNADVILVRSADCLTEDYGVLGLFSNLRGILYAILLKKPVMVFAGSIGPFKKTYTRIISRSILNNVDLITVREEISERYLKSIGITSLIYLTADSAFALDTIRKPEALKILKNYGYHGKRDIIGICPSKLVSKYGSISYGGYVELISNLADELIKKLDVTVLLIPHVYGPGNGTDDRIIIRDIYKHMTNKNRVILIEDELKPEQLRGVIGSCDLLISARTHAIISALSMGVPALAISYSHKTMGVMSFFGLENWVVDITSINLKDASSKVSQLWTVRNDLIKNIKKRAKIARNKAFENGVLASSLIERNR